jgi:hypothetical protein
MQFTSPIRRCSFNAKAFLLTGSEIGRGWSILRPVSTTKLEQLSNEANCRLGPDESPGGGVIASVSFISPDALSEMDESLVVPAAPSGAYSRIVDHVHLCVRTIDQVVPGSRKPVSYPLVSVASPGVGTSSIGLEAELGSKANPHFYFRYYIEVGKVIVEVTTLSRDAGSSFSRRMAVLAVTKVTA